ncbi:hypothetical protein E2562_029495 [Oryza meyeriana var. granulata]|uniref:Uncharacterized protein n=1 Tax=Oryza meyeriana var. granulata TaxID=110450 RepID=A0A6G1FDV0_9ORYZ|nr:hypothetical protein E2562_029495 [Oryza meyeriana var. granulata]
MGNAMGQGNRRKKNHGSEPEEKGDIKGGEGLRTTAIDLWSPVVFSPLSPARARARALVVFSHADLSI